MRAPDDLADGGAAAPCGHEDQQRPRLLTVKSPRRTPRRGRQPSSRRAGRLQRSIAPHSKEGIGGGDHVAHVGPDIRHGRAALPAPMVIPGAGLGRALLTATALIVVAAVRRCSGGPPPGARRPWRAGRVRALWAWFGGGASMPGDRAPRRRGGGPDGWCWRRGRTSRLPAATSAVSRPCGGRRRRRPGAPRRRSSRSPSWRPPSSWPAAAPGSTAAGRGRQRSRRRSRGDRGRLLRSPTATWLGPATNPQRSRERGAAAPRPAFHDLRARPHALRAQERARGARTCRRHAGGGSGAPRGAPAHGWRGSLDDLRSAVARLPAPAHVVRAGSAPLQPGRRRHRPARRRPAGRPGRDSAGALGLGAPRGRDERAQHRRARRWLGRAAARGIHRPLEVEDDGGAGGGGAGQRLAGIAERLGALDGSIQGVAPGWRGLPGGVGAGPTRRSWVLRRRGPAIDQGRARRPAARAPGGHRGGGRGGQPATKAWRRRCGSSRDVARGHRDAVRRRAVGRDELGRGPPVVPRADPAVFGRPATSSGPSPARRRVPPQGRPGRRAARALRRTAEGSRDRSPSWRSPRSPRVTSPLTAGSGTCWPSASTGRASRTSRAGSPDQLTVRTLLSVASRS